MRLEYADFIMLLMKAYNRKRSTDLSPLLAQSSPAKIRKECVNVYEERYREKDDQLRRKDEQILRAFFGSAEPGKALLRAIEEFPTDKFRPLDSYLKAGISKTCIDDMKSDFRKTDTTNLNLLAWLIDFPYRPFVYGMEVILTDEEMSIIGRKGDIKIKPPAPPPKPTGDENPEGKKTPLEPPGTPSSFKEKKENKRRRWVVFFLIFSACVGGLYFLWQQKWNNKIVYAYTGCMYWAGDHYEEISCNDKTKDRLKWPIDSEKMKSFKRIMQEDTITERSINSVYYSKINNKIEYYTSGGNHPVNILRILKPLSRYMFEKYLCKHDSADKGSLAERNLNFANHR